MSEILLKPKNYLELCQWLKSHEPDVGDEGKAACFRLDYNDTNYYDLYRARQIWSGSGGPVSCASRTVLEGIGYGCSVLGSRGLLPRP